MEVASKVIVILNMSSILNSDGFSENGIGKIACKSQRWSFIFFCFAGGFCALEGRGEASFLMTLMDLISLYSTGCALHACVSEVEHCTPAVTESKKWGISLRQLWSFYTGMMQGRKSRQIQLVKIRNCSAASLAGCVRAGLSTNKVTPTPHSLTEARSLQPPGISVSRKPGKCCFRASNTSCWQAYLAGSRHWSKHAVCFVRFTKVGLIIVRHLNRVWEASCGLQWEGMK